MPHTITRRINARSLSLLFIFVGLPSLMALASGHLNLSRTTAHAGGGNGPTTGLALSSGAAAQTPGAISFSSDNYSVSESASGATITLKRAGGTDNKVSAKVTLTDVTTPRLITSSPPALSTTHSIPWRARLRACRRWPCNPTGGSSSSGHLPNSTAPPATASRGFAHEV